MPERTLTLMAVHAHPDDEATGTGGVLAKYAADGVQTVLVTCTDGRCGDGPGGVKPGEPGHDPDQVVAMRQRELEASCATLDVTHLELLGYGDSGMMGWATNDAPGAFWTTPVDQAATRLAALIERYRPDVIVTYDANGFYGHPDHIQAHRVTMAAVAMTAAASPATAAPTDGPDSGPDSGPAAGPAKVYWTTTPRSQMEEFGRVMRELGADWDEPGPNGDEDQVQIGLPDEQITTWVDTRAFGVQKFEALKAHASQSENIFFLRMGQERFTEMMGIETFVRVDVAPVIPVHPDEREDDLFAGRR